MLPQLPSSHPREHTFDCGAASHQRGQLPEAWRHPVPTGPSTGLTLSGPAAKAHPDMKCEPRNK